MSRSIIQIVVLVVLLFSGYGIKAQSKMQLLRADVLTFLSEGNFERAEKVLRNARGLSMQEDSVEALWGYYHYIKGDTSRALRIWNERLKYNRKSSILIEQFMFHSVQKKNCRKAIEYVDAIIKNNPAAPRWYVMKSLLLWSMADSIPAKRHLEKALTLKGGSMAHFYLGLFAYESSNYALAEKKFTLALKAKPNVGEMYCYRGLCSLNLKDTANASADWNRYIELGNSGEIIKLNGSCRWGEDRIDFSESEGFMGLQEIMGQKNQETYIDSYRAYMSAGAYTKARNAIQKALVLDPNSDTCFVFLGKAFYALGHIDSAVATFQKAIDLNTNNKAAHFNLVKCKLDMNNREEAVETLKSLVRQMPDYTPTYMFIAEVYRKHHLHKNALYWYKKAIAIDAKNPEPYFQRAMVYRHMALDHNFDDHFQHEDEPYEHMIGNLNKAIELNSTNSDYYFYRGEAFLRITSYAHAKNDISRLMGMIGYNRTNLTLFAEIYQTQGQHKRAIEIYDKIIESVASDLNSSDTTMKLMLDLRQKRILSNVRLRKHEMVLPDIDFCVKKGNYPKVYFHTSTCYFDSHQFRRALKIANQYEQEERDEIPPDFYLFRSKLKMLLQDYTGQCLDLKKAGKAGEEVYLKECK